MIEFVLAISESWIFAQTVSLLISLHQKHESKQKVNDIVCENHISQSVDYYASFEPVVIFFLVNNETLHCGYKFIFPTDNKTGSTHIHTHTHTRARAHSPEYLKHTTDKTTNRT